MSRSKEFVREITELLSPLGTVRSKSMFGGWGFYVNEHFIAIIADEALYFKTDGSTALDYIAAGMEPFTYETKAGRHTMNYYQVPESAMERPGALLPWAKAALGVALRAPKKKSAKGKSAIILLFLGLCCIGQLWAQEPMLPTRSELEETALPADLLLPASHAGLLPALEDPLAVPTALPPPTAMPELPIYAPEGGAEMPDIPNFPGLVLPKVNVRSAEQAEQDTKPTEPVTPNPTAPAPTAKPGSDLVAVKRVESVPSPREARELSIAEGKPMLMVVGGFEWSPPCRAMNTDLLAHTAFQNMMRQNGVVYTYLNVPQKKVVEDPKLEAQWNAIVQYRQFLKIKKLPTIIMFDPQGKELARETGYNYSTANRRYSFHQKFNRIAGTFETERERLKKQEAVRKLMREVQSYRDWTSTAGTRLFAKVVRKLELPVPRVDDPNAVEEGVLLRDEDQKDRNVPLRLLSESDQEFLLLKWAQS
jgi:DNA transformation protein and related proteins